MRSRSCCATLLLLFALSVPASAQSRATPAPSLKAVPIKSPKHKYPAQSAKFSAKPRPKRETGSLEDGTWIQINAHAQSGETTWVNLTQAGSIRFYQAGKTPFAAVGTGGSSFVSTSNPAEIQKLRAYVLSHQVH